MSTATFHYHQNRIWDANIQQDSRKRQTSPPPCNKAALWAIQSNRFLLAVGESISVGQGVTDRSWMTTAAEPLYTRNSVKKRHSQN